MSEHLKVVPLPEPTREATQAIEALRILISEFERGDVESFVLVARRSGGSLTRARGIPDHANRFALLGAVQHEMITLSRLIDAECEAQEISAPPGE